MAKVRVTIEGDKEIAAALKAKEGAAQNILRQAVEEGALLLASEIDARSPSLDKSIFYDVVDSKGDSVLVEIGPDKEHFYLQFFEYGTDPRTIRPDIRQALELSDGSFAARVNHPGTPARPFMRPGFDAGQADAIAEIEAELKKGLGL